MKRQPYPIANLVDGLIKTPDPVFLPDPGSPSMKNFVFKDGMLRKDYGWKSFGTGNCANYVMKIDSFPLRTGSTRTIVITTANFYRYVIANDAFEAQNANAFTGNETNRFSSTTIHDVNANEIYVFTNGVDPIKKWDGSNNTANLGGWTGVTARYVATFKNRLFAGFTTEGGVINPQRIQWSVAGDPEDKANSGSGFFDLVDTSDWVSGFAFIKDRMFALKERSIWEIVHVGGNNYFTPERVVDAVGTFSPDAIVSLGDAIIIFGSDDVYIYDGHNLESIGQQIYPLLYETADKIVNADEVIRSVGEYIEEVGEYWLCVPTTGTIPDTVFKYNFQTKSWTMRDEQVTAYGFYEADSGNAWQDLVGNWNDWTGNWMDSSLRSGAPTTLKGMANGFIFEDDRLQGDSNYAYFESKDLMFGHAHRVLELRAKIKGGPCNMSCSLDGGNTWLANKEFANTGNDWTEITYELNKTTQKLRLRIDTLAANFEVKWVEPWFISRKRSKSVERPI